MNTGIKRIEISAKPGDPSTMWMSESGKIYRKLKEAQMDKGQTINPDDYEIDTNWFTRNWKTCAICSVIAVIISGLTLYCYINFIKK